MDNEVNKQRIVDYNLMFLNVTFLCFFLVRYRAAVYFLITRPLKLDLLNDDIFSPFHLPLGKLVI